MLRLFDTLTRQVRPVEPAAPPDIRMYSCGPTVYRYVHIGNLRTFMLADLVRRTLAYHGHEVTAVMNITDVGHMTDEITEAGRDRMELASADEGLSPGEIAEKYTAAFLTDCDAVNIRRFDAYPKATDHIPEMIELTAKLLERDHAYEVDGNVYFDVTTFAGYGGLSNQSLDAMRAGHRVDVDSAKRNHQDFTLWRAAGGARLMRWESPWGPGYPGWHIECSAMSMKLLGDVIDIHTGGVDNIFPHHEDEIAQSEGAVGHRVVGTWVHGEHLLMGEAKMAKSSGNVLRISDVAQHGHDPLSFRYLCWTARYRRQFGFSADALGAAGTALKRLRERLATLGSPPQAPATDPVLRRSVQDPAGIDHHRRFMDAIDDDLDTPLALAVLHEMLGDDRVSPSDRLLLAGSWDHILGLDLLGSESLPPDLAQLVDEREKARAAKDWHRADELRDQLRGSGIDVIDTPDGPRWVRER